MRGGGRRRRLFENKELMREFEMWLRRRDRSPDLPLPAPVDADDDNENGESFQCAYCGYTDSPPQSPVVYYPPRMANGGRDMRRRSKSQRRAIAGGSVNRGALAISDAPPALASGSRSREGESTPRTPHSCVSGPGEASARERARRVVHISERERSSLMLRWGRLRPEKVESAAKVAKACVAEDFRGRGVPSPCAATESYIVDDESESSAVIMNGSDTGEGARRPLRRPVSLTASARGLRGVAIGDDPDGVLGDRAEALFDLRLAEREARGCVPERL